MTHDPTRPAHARQGWDSPPGGSVDTGQPTGRLTVAVDGQRVRVCTPQFSTPWLPDTPSHRHLAVVWCRLLGDDQGQSLFT
jgi:hypothetical protein